MWLLQRMWKMLDFPVVGEDADIVENIIRVFVFVLSSAFIFALTAFSISGLFTLGETNPASRLPLLVHLLFTPFIVMLVVICLAGSAFCVKNLYTAFGAIRKQIKQEKAGQRPHSTKELFGFLSSPCCIELIPDLSDQNSVLHHADKKANPRQGRTVEQGRRCRRSRLRPKPPQRTRQVRKHPLSVEQKRQSQHSH